MNEKFCTFASVQDIQIDRPKKDKKCSELAAIVVITTAVNYGA